MLPPKQEDVNTLCAAAFVCLPPVAPPPSQVRFSSLLLLLEVASKLKENYMVLLPETIPFLAELMEGE